MSEMPDVATLTTISSDWGNDIRDRTVQRYSSVANRTSEHASPAEGDLSYLEDSNTVWMYNGTAWVELFSATIDTADITNGAVTAAKLTLGWITDSPAFGNVSAGGAGFAQSLEHIQIGKTVICRGHFVLGTGGSVAGLITLTLPVTAASAELNTPIGLCRMVSTFLYTGEVQLSSTTACAFYANSAGGSFVLATATSATVPFTWAATDGLYFQFTYEAA